MKEPPRHKNVPPEAHWHKEDEVWRLGKYSPKGKKNTIGTGEWRYWRPDGHLVCICNFDDEGRQDGINERFHPDGTVASRGEWKKGSRSGHFVFARSKNESNEDYPASYNTWRYEFDSENNWSEKNPRWFLEDGTECTSDGRPLAAAFDLEEVILASEPEDFLSNYAQKVREAFGEQAGEVGGTLKKDHFNLAEIWGLSDEDNTDHIDKFVAYAVEADGFSKSDTRRQFEGNIWKTVIEHPWENQHEELGALFMSAVKIGTLGDSDSVYATILHQRRKTPIKNAVYLWDHDTLCIDEIISPDLDSFAYRCAVAGAIYCERISKEVSEKAWQKLKGKACVGYHCSAGLEEGNHEFTDNLDPVNDLRGSFWRSDWICQLLDSDRDRNMEYVKDSFYKNWNPAYDDEKVDERIEAGKKLPSVAMYLLWRFFFFAQEERLEKSKNAFRKHSAKVVRDLVELLDEIEKGNTKIGGIKDILAVRKEFLKLDLCPERESERAEESKEADKQESERLEKVAQTVTLDASGGEEKLLQKAWDSVSDVATMKIIEEHVRKIPGNEMQWKAFDWVRNGGFERANQTLLDEARALGAWMATKETRLLEPFIWSCLYDNKLAVPHSLLGENENLDERIVPACLSVLDIVEQYNHKRQLAVKILGTVKAAQTAPRLCKLIDEYFGVIEKLTGFDVSLATIPWDDMLVEIAKSLEKMATQDISKEDRKLVVNSLKRLAKRAIKEYRWEIAASCLNALVAWKDYEILDLIKGLLGGNDDFAFTSALRAVEAVAEKLDKKERRLFAAIEFRNPADHENEVTLLYCRAHNALVKADPELGDPIDMNQAVEESLELSNYGDGWKSWRLTLCETVANFPELSLDLIKEYLYSCDVSLRQAAEAAFLKRNVEAPERRPVSWAQIWLFEQISKDKEEAIRWICDLLSDERTVERTCLAAWLCENTSEQGANALCQLMQKLLANYKIPESGEYTNIEIEWLTRALLKHSNFELAAKAIELCLNSGDESLVRLIEFEKQSV